MNDELEKVDEIIFQAIKELYCVSKKIPDLNFSPIENVQIRGKINDKIFHLEKALGERFYYENIGKIGVINGNSC